jgi:hypothetical protein
MTLPAGIVASMIGSSGPGCRVRSQQWLPWTMRVAPFSVVKSSSAHIVLSTTSPCGSARG